MKAMFMKYNSFGLLIIVTTCGMLCTIHCWMPSSSLVEMYSPWRSGGDVFQHMFRTPYQRRLPIPKHRHHRKLNFNSFDSFMLSHLTVTSSIDDTNNESIEQQRKQQDQRENQVSISNPTKKNYDRQTKSKPSFSQDIYTIKPRNGVQKKDGVNKPKTPKNTRESAKIVNTITRQRNDDERKLYNSDSSIGTLHMERIASAGRAGTKRFIDPCKVYIGNLPFSYTDSMLNDWICNTVLGLPASTVINQCKIIYDWKTSRSKGYGFVVVTEPIYATILIEKCNSNATIGTVDSRRLTVSQGISKDREEQLDREEQAWLEREKKRSMRKNNNNETETVIEMDIDEIRMLKMLDPDLVEGVKVKESSIKQKPADTSNEVSIKIKEESSFVLGTKDMTDADTAGYDESDNDMEDEYFTNNVDEDDSDDDDDDDVYDWESIDAGVIYDDSDEGVDGIWLDDNYDDDLIATFVDDIESTTNNNSTSGTGAMLNREQRRNATLAAKKRRKLPYKGFG